MFEMLSKAGPLLKSAGRLAGIVRTQVDGAPVKAPNTRLVAAGVGVIAAFGWLAPDQVNALIELILAVMEVGNTE
tara:strand:+ start:1077 stop:1301 length:225 start_codon:yes stop_codon:yes gene_type:complete